MSMISPRELLEGFSILEHSGLTKTRSEDKIKVARTPSGTSEFIISKTSSEGGLWDNFAR